MRLLQSVALLYLGANWICSRSSSGNGRAFLISKITASIISVFIALGFMIFRFSRVSDNEVTLP